MKVQITRRMTVANDAGESETFEPTGEGQFREDISEAVYRRLNRAGAASVVPEDGGSDQASPNMTTDAETATAADNTNGVYSPVSTESAELQDRDASHQDIEDVRDDETGEVIDFEKMTKAELLAYAEARNIENVDASMKKDDIIFGIKGAMSAGE